MEKADTVFHENMRVMVSVSQAESTLRNGAADFLARYGGKVFDVERVEMRGCSCGTNNGSHHDNCLIALGGKQKVWLKGVKNPFSCDLLLAVPK